MNMSLSLIRWGTMSLRGIQDDRTNFLLQVVENLEKLSVLVTLEQVSFLATTWNLFSSTFQA